MPTSLGEPLAPAFETPDRMGRYGPNWRQRHRCQLVRLTNAARAVRIVGTSPTIAALPRRGVSSSYAHWHDEVGSPGRNTADSRLVPPAQGQQTLLAPGSDFALSTATMFDIEFDGEPTVRVQIPSVAGAIYAKASAAKELDPKDRPLKHLHDAAQLLGVVRLDELVGHGPAMGRRLRWLRSALGSTDSPGWQYVPLAKRSDPALRLTVAAADY